MRYLILPVMLCTLNGCTRSLTEVRPPPEAEPEYLGEFSGVYASLMDESDRSGRTVVIQLHDKIVVTPFVVEGGEPKLSVFASVFDLSVAADIYAVPTGVVMQPGEGGGADGTCDPNDLIPADPTEQVAAFIQRIVDCKLEPSTCTPLCILPGTYKPEDTLVGECIGEGELCRYPFDVGVRLGRDLLELLFQQSGPNTTQAGLDCVADPAGSGWQRCVAASWPCPPNAPEWKSCIGLPRLCDFDSGLAGVYQATLTLDPARTTDPNPPSAAAQIDLAVAVASHMPAATIFMSDERLGDRLVFGTFDLATLELEGNDGETPMDAAWQIRNGKEPAINLSARLVEDKAAGLVSLTGTWTETRVVGSEELVTAYALAGSRLSGTTAGTDCSPLGGCSTGQLICPLGNTTDIVSGSLSTESGLSDQGCVVTECRRYLDPRSSLSAPLPDPNDPATPESCVGMRVREDAYTMALDIWLSPPACPPVGDCWQLQSQVEFRCHDEASLGPATPQNIFSIDARCFSDPSVMVLRYGDGGSSTRIECDDHGDNARTCPSRAVSCPLGASYSIPTSIAPRVDDQGCIDYQCDQWFEAHHLCSDIGVPVCSNGQAPTPVIVSGGSAWGDDCIDYQCADPCSSDCGGNTDCSGQLCANSVGLDCRGGPVTVRADCSNCIALECGAASCDSGTVNCPLGASDAVDTELRTRVESTGCVTYDCAQNIYSHRVCTDPPIPTCGAGETLVPEIRRGDQSTSDCVAYACRPSCGTSCGGSCNGEPPCADFDPLSCGNRPVHVSWGCEGCLRLSCGVSACDSPPPDCAMEPSYRVSTQLVPQVDWLGCVSYQCQQSYSPSDQCPESPPACPEGEGLVPHQRVGGGDCIEYLCQAECDQCSSFDVSHCGTDPITVSSGCRKGCASLGCGERVCEDRPVHCPMNGTNDNNLFQRQFLPYLDQDGCMFWNCRQWYRDGEKSDPTPGDECNGEGDPTTSSCGTGEAKVPEVVYDNGWCVKYTCKPTCTTDSECHGCCADPAIPQSCSSGDVLWIIQGCANCVEVSCGPAPAGGP